MRIIIVGLNAALLQPRLTPVTVQHHDGMQHCRSW